MQLLRALRIRAFGLLWAGQTISRFGDFLFQVSLAWWVLEKTGSATVMGTVLIFSLVPMLVFVLLGGVAVDRLPRIPLMLGSDLARGAIQSVVAVLAFAQVLEVWHILITSVLFGIVDAFFQPAYVALVPEVTPAEDLPSANALTSLSMQIGRIAGPALSGLLIAFGGTAIAFAVDAATFFISALFLLPLLKVALPRPMPEAVFSIWHDLRAGIGIVVGLPWLWITMTMQALTNVTLAGPFQVAIPFLVDDHFGGDARMLGLLYAAFPVGYVIGGVWLGRQARIRHRGWIVYVGTGVAGLGMLAIGLPITIAGALIAAVVNGAALEMGALIWTNTLQELVPNERLGRIASIDMLATYALIPVGFALAGWATNAFGAATVCILGGAITAAVAGLGLLHPAIRHLD